MPPFDHNLQKVIELEVKLHQSEVRNNRDELLRLLHPSFQEVGKSGHSFTRQSIIESLMLEEDDDYQILSQNFKPTLLAEGVILLLYQSVLKKSSVLSGYAKRSSIWVLNSSQHSWQVLYHQGTPCEAFDIVEP